MGIRELEPRSVFGYFAKILEIPRPSKHEERIIEYLRAFADARGLEYQQDAKGNVVIRRTASVGAEGWTPVILQSHMDMVCEKSADVEHNFMTDPISAYVEDGWVKARGTTLGADCGIGMAMQLAVLADTDTVLPAIEALFTVDEEQGLTGAMALGEGMLKYSRMINLDSEDQGEIFIGCAGGVDTLATFDCGAEAGVVGDIYRVVVGGLRGGHSGDDINKGRASATRVLARVLTMLQGEEFGARVVTIDAGNLRNAIARDGVAEVLVKPGMGDRVVAAVAAMNAELQAEFSVADPQLSVSVEKTGDGVAKTCFESGKQRRFLQAMIGVPNGVLQDSVAMEGLVETSSNLASIKMTGSGVVEVTTSQRSMTESAKWAARDSVAAVFHLAGATVRHSDGYPGWKPNPQGDFVQSAAGLYKSMFGVDPKVRAIHAGLECGLFLDKYPNLDIISFGPTLRDVHSPSERMLISSVQQSWQYLLGLLQLDKK